jgi:hypothetical protein
LFVIFALYIKSDDIARKLMYIDFIEDLIQNIEDKSCA